MSSAFAENVEFFRPNRQRHSFGTRGSQVQILPLRPALSQNQDTYRHRLRHRFASVTMPWTVLNGARGFAN